MIAMELLTKPDPGKCDCLNNPGDSYTHFPIPNLVGKGDG